MGCNQLRDQSWGMSNIRPSTVQTFVSNSPTIAHTFMAKARIQFLCNSCGSVHPKWLGKCPDCNAWDTLEQYKEPTADPRAASRAPLGTRGGQISADAFAGAEAVAID